MRGRAGRARRRATRLDAAACGHGAGAGGAWLRAWRLARTRIESNLLNQLRSRVWTPKFRINRINKTTTHQNFLKAARRSYPPWSLLELCEEHWTFMLAAYASCLALILPSPRHPRVALVAD